MSAAMSNVKELQFKLDFVTEENKAVLKPYLYLCKEPGKGIRSMFNIAVKHVSKVFEDDLRGIMDIVGHLHNISLLLDDIQDNSVLRRGKPAVHKIHGVAQTLNSCSYMIFVLWDKCLKCHRPKETLELVMDAMLEMVKGQGMELYWRDNFICPTEEEYMLMITRKSGALFQLGIDLQKLYAPKYTLPEVYGIELGRYFQIIDDYQNLTNEKFFELKGYCDDITEGKFSYPIMHAINNYPEEGALIKDILSQRTRDVELKKQCVALLHKCGSLAHTKKKLEELKANFVQIAENLNYGEEFQTAIQSLTDSLYLDGTQ